MIRKTLYGIIIAGLILSNSYADNEFNSKSNYQNQQTNSKLRAENPIYPIGVIIGSLTVSAGAAYYAIRQGRKNREKLDAE